MNETSINEHQIMLPIYPFLVNQVTIHLEAQINILIAALILGQTRSMLGLFCE